jgi:hypothetical protein
MGVYSAKIPTASRAISRAVISYRGSPSCPISTRWFINKNRLPHSYKAGPDRQRSISARNSSSVGGYQVGCVSGYVSGCVSGCVSSSLLRREEGDSVIDILIETSNNSREDIDRHETNIGTNIDIGAAIEVGKIIDILIELGSSGAGCRAGCRVGCRVGYRVGYRAGCKMVEVCLKISISD